MGPSAFFAKYPSRASPGHEILASRSQDPKAMSKTDYEREWPKLTPVVCRDIIADIKRELDNGVTEARRIQLEHRQSVLERIAKEYERV
jgi:hypothetical protein